jgi:hypothetical protein
MNGMNISAAAQMSKWRFNSVKARGYIDATEDDYARHPLATQRLYPSRP